MRYNSADYNNGTKIHIIIETVVDWLSTTNRLSTTNTLSIYVDSNRLSTNRQPCKLNGKGFQFTCTIKPPRGWPNCSPPPTHTHKVWLWHGDSTVVLLKSTYHSEPLVLHRVRWWCDYLFPLASQRHLEDTHVWLDQMKSIIYIYIYILYMAVCVNHM